MPVEAMLIGNLHADAHPIEERFATAIGSAPVLLGDLRRLSDADRRWWHEKVGWFKNLRKTTQISESFFPLGSWQQTTPAAWDGFARLAPNGSGVICVFRNQARVEEAVVQLPLMPEGRHGVRSVMNDKDLGVFAKSDWTRGVRVPFADGATVEVLEVKALP
jgi:alpha-galactosidase